VSIYGNSITFPVLYQ